MRHTAAQYSAALRSLFPQGSLFDSEFDPEFDPALDPELQDDKKNKSDINLISDAWAKEWARWNERLYDLLRQVDPSTATELLIEWGVSVGITDIHDPKELRRLILDAFNQTLNNNIEQHQALSHDYAFNLDGISLGWQDRVWVCGDDVGMSLPGIAGNSYWHWYNRVDKEAVLAAETTPDDFTVFTCGSSCFERLYPLTDWYYYSALVCDRPRYEGAVKTILLESIIRFLAISMITTILI